MPEPQDEAGEAYKKEIDGYIQIALGTLETEGEEVFSKKVKKLGHHPVLKPEFEKINPS